MSQRSSVIIPRVAFQKLCEAGVGQPRLRHSY